MALIECPECKHQVSDSADACPSCGFNIKKRISYCPYCELLNNKKVLMSFSIANNEYTCPECNKTVGIATPEMEANWAIQKQMEQNLPKCPYCSSTDLKKISGLSKAGSVALWGVFAMGKVSKQWHCNSCKSDF